MTGRDGAQEAKWQKWRSVADLYHAYFTGLILTVVTRRGTADAEILAGPAQQHHAGRLRRRVDDAGQLQRHGIRHGIAGVGPVDGDAQNAAILFDNEILAHGLLRLVLSFRGALLRPGMTL